LVGRMQEGKSAKVKILREGKEEELEVTVGKADAEKFAGHPKQGQWGGDSGKADVLGLVVQQITPREATQLDLPADYKGVVI
ncbi:MAG: hypothetical protein GWN87_03560, partial [Desulfuromonadales bacterium]|nr:hypothetical protein [Desulfuromonadales bacterium]